MTRQEKYAVLRAAPETIVSEWRDIDDTLVAVKAGPCPFFVFHTCLVYASRPYNCRRFGCMRPDPKTEPYEADDPHFGCKNFTDRFLLSRQVRRLATLMQRRAQRWARAHGWKDETC
jgi:Fe-S-cluster containining protein